MPVKLQGKQWALCYSSFTNDSSTPRTFHDLCDQYSTTLLVVHNSLNYTFGAYVGSHSSFRCFLVCPPPSLSLACGFGVPKP